MFAVARSVAVLDSTDDGHNFGLVFKPNHIPRGEIRWGAHTAYSTRIDGTEAAYLTPVYTVSGSVLAILLDLSLTLEPTGNFLLFLGNFGV